ncbi:MAG: ATP-binding cassette domain-containing protein [Rudaea sp.]|nr:ATP-binding cassette domain-containing protein [Rudaea sp.]
MQLEIDIEKSLRSRGREFRLALRFASDADVNVLFGPSGAGKTVTLHAIAGLLRPDRGEVRLGTDVWFSSAQKIDVAARRRNIGFVFQDYALFPHLSVMENVAFARRHGLLKRNRVENDLKELMAEFELDELAHAFPAQLSGGQRQRVALARALAARPRLLLLDEPFAALDAPLRARLRGELLTMRARFGVPMIVITHDPEDVTALGGCTIHIDGGRLIGSSDK